MAQSPPLPPAPLPRPVAPVLLRRGRGAWGLAAAAVLAAVAVGGCASTDRDGGQASATTTVVTLVPPPSPTAPRSTLPVPPPGPDTRHVALPALQGPAPTTTLATPLEVYGGEASLWGSLAYDGEPVAGATVQLERWVGGRSSAVTLTTGPGGGWEATDIHGGRYVIRAWKGSRLVLEQASAVFLADDERRAVHLAMVAAAPPPPPDDDTRDDDTRDDEADEDDDDGAKDDGGSEDDGDREAGR